MTGSYPNWFQPDKESLARRIVLENIIESVGWEALRSVNVLFQVFVSKSFMDCDVVIESRETGQPLRIGTYLVDLETNKFIIKPSRWDLQEALRKFNGNETAFKIFGQRLARRARAMSLDEFELRYLYDVLVSIIKCQNRFEELPRHVFSREGIRALAKYYNLLKREKAKYGRSTYLEDRRTISFLSSAISLYKGNTETTEEDVREGYHLYLSLLHVAYASFPREIPSFAPPPIRLNIDSSQIRIFEGWMQVRELMRQKNPVLILNSIVGAAKAMFAVDSITTTIEKLGRATMEDLIEAEDCFEEAFDLPLLPKVSRIPIKRLEKPDLYRKMKETYVDIRYRARRMLETASEYEKRGEIEKAVEAYEKAIETMPSLMFEGKLPSSPTKVGRGTKDDFRKVMKKGPF